MDGRLHNTAVTIKCTESYTTQTLRVTGAKTVLNFLKFYKNKLMKYKVYLSCCWAKGDNTL